MARIEVHPAASNLDVRLVYMPLATHRALAPVEALHQQRREVDDPAVDRRMVDADTALSRHFFQIPQAQAMRQDASARTAGSLIGRNDGL